MIRKLEDAMREMPQIDCPTAHYYAGGMYCRTLLQGAGTLIVGKVHKKEHFFIVAKGRIRVALGDDLNEYEAGAVLVSQPGTKRAIHALEDSLYMTVHPTKKKNLDKIEKELIEPDAKALFDSRNRLKELT